MTGILEVGQLDFLLNSKDNFGALKPRVLSLHEVSGEKRHERAGSASTTDLAGGPLEIKGLDEAKLQLDADRDNKWTEILKEVEKVGGFTL